MPKATGLMHPDNASAGGGFKEGVIRIDSNSYKVHKGQPGEGEAPIPATKWSWMATRMDEGGNEPLTDDHDQPIVEELLFSFGGKCLPFVHPGQASNPDEEPEDLGTSEKTEGNTVYLVGNDWKPNEKSGLMVLTRSMVNLSVKAEYLNRCWAPDWNGCVFEVRSQQGEKGADGRAFNYKVISRVLVGPGSSSAKAGAKAGKTGNGRVGDAESYLGPILNALSEELDGTQISRKAFQNRVRAALDAKKVDSKLLLPVLQLCKDEEWLKSHGETFDFYLSDTGIVFGTLPAV